MEENGNISTLFLAKTFGVSKSSIRRDISYITSLNRYKSIKRVHGGIILDMVKQEHEYMFDLKLSVNEQLKNAITERAIEFVNDGESIIIDSGTTCLHFAQKINRKKNIKAIVLDIKIGEELGKYGDIEASIIGGVIRPGYFTVGGINALENLDQFIAQKVFMSVDAIDIGYGITNTSEFEVGVKKKIIELGKHVYVMADYTKFGKHTLYKVAELNKIDTIISNKELDTSYAERIRELGIELILV